jgi:hypothetical protein
LIPYLEAFDASGEREPFRSILSTEVVPSLIGTLADEGLDVLVSHDLASKAAYNAVHVDDPLLTRLSLVDPRYQPHATADDVLCCYLEFHGELVGSIVLRLLWCEPSFGACLEDLSLLYADPLAMAADDEIAICQPSVAWERLKAVHVAMTLGGHVRNDFRKTIAYDGLWRLARIKALVDWKWSYSISLLEMDVARKLGFRLYGHQQGSPGVFLGRGDDLHPYCLYVSERAHLRRIFGRPEAGDLSRGVGDLTLADLREARSRRGYFLAAE